MIFGGIAKTSSIDFPGVLSCVLFTKGCNYNCFYCHNRELISAHGDTLDYDEVVAFLKKRAGLLDGVVISGGEPTLQPDLAKFCLFVKSLGYKVKLDTNGSAPGIVEEILSKNAVDYFAVDYKSPSCDYEKVCGGDAESVRKTIEILTKSGVNFEVRTTLYPTLSLDGLKSLMAELPKVMRYRLNFFKKPPENHVDFLKEALTKHEIKQNFAELKKIQPNLIEA